MHDRVVVFLSLIVHSLSLYKLDSLAIMHEKCLLDGLRAKGCTSLNMCNDKEGNSTDNL